MGGWMDERGRTQDTVEIKHKKMIGDGVYHMQKKTRKWKTPLNDSQAMGWQGIILHEKTSEI